MRLYFNIWDWGFRFRSDDFTCDSRHTTFYEIAIGPFCFEWERN